jgi:hypothetical protein
MTMHAARFLVIVAALTLTAGSLAVVDQPAGLPLARAQSLPTVSPTPTPRVIVINQPTPVLTPTTAAGQGSVIEIEPPESTATTAPHPTSTPYVLPTPVPTATPTVPPPTLPTAIPTATATPQPPAAIPTIAPAAGTRISFAAEDWEGGYYRGDSQAYGRPWVALYGASSAYPRARLSFRLDADAVGETLFTVTGLDDEWTAPNEIRLEVNGAPVYTGPSPFPNWDGVGNGANAAWTGVSFTLPPGMLSAGRNTIEIANLTPGSNYNAPPYVLLADASLQIPGFAAGQTPPVDEPQSTESALVTFTAEDWRGGFYRGDGQAYGRPWVALYGAQSDYPSATLRFRIRGEEPGLAILRLTGLDDELPELNPMALIVNGVEIYAGPSPFPNWDGMGDGSNAAWTEISFQIPAGVLRSGRNEIEVANLTPSASFDAPPYILLSDAEIEIQAGG